MAEGGGRSLLGEKYNFYSAGITKHGLNSYAVKVMQEAEVDISKHKSNTVEELEDLAFDVVFTVCDHAKESCPVLAGARMVHIPFDDPPNVTKNIIDEEKKLAVYRRVRDEIKEFILGLENLIV